MKLFARIFLISLLAVCASSVFAQDQKTGSVTGRVTVDGRAAAGVIVLLYPSASSPAQRTEQSLTGASPIRTTTDENGNYRFPDVSAGRYRIVLYALSHVAAPDSKSGGSERDITVADNQTVEAIDFALIRGGVITGRVTDANGRPLIREMIAITGADDSDSTHPSYLNNLGNLSMFLTDDRGAYRIYGLPPGKYFVSAGGARMLFFFGDRKSTSTYYPGVTDRARAKPVEVTAGGETTGIDIRVTPSAKGYQASGRVIDGDTGKPLPNAMVLFMPAGEKDDTFFTNFPGGVSSTGPKGEFHLDNIPSGVYTATAQFVERESEYYSEMASFEIKSADATGIEIKLRRGSSISGFVIVEDTTDPEILARLPQVVLTANSTAGEDSSPGLEFSGPGRGKILPDGSFRVWGLRPGTVRIHAGGLPGLKLARVERDGLNQKDGIELKAGEQISGVRLVFATASGVIRGRVVIEGGPLPVGTALIVSVENAGDDDSNNDGVAVGDATGNFTIENLLPGTYEVRVRAMREGQPTGLPEAKQTVNVVKDVPAEVTLVLNLKPKND